MNGFAIKRENSEEYLSEQDKIFLTLERLKNDYKNEIPLEIVRSTDKDNKYKIRKGWFQALFFALEKFCQNFADDKTADDLRKEIKVFVQKISQKGRKENFNAEDIKEADKLIDKILNFKN